VDLQTAIDLATTANRRVVLRRRPEGLLSKDDVDVEHGVALPELADGEALLEVEWIGIDATVRTWLSKAEGYLPAVEIGETVRASGIGRVVATRCETFPLGEFVYGLPGWQRYGVVRDDPLATHLGADVDPPAMLSVYGATGLTAYVGIVDVAAAAEGETVVVSAAAGATGSLAAQIAKITGCRVVGICGSDDKAHWLTGELGLDGAINHRTEDVHTRLKELCPDRVDVYFDNVGGPILDAVLDRLAMHARVVLCGAIAIYNEHGRPPGRPTTSSSSTAGRGWRASCRSTTGTGSRRWRPRSAPGWPRASCATAPRCTRGSTQRSTPSTPCSPAPTRARRSSGSDGGLAA
jgi:NADPH-dependent curcumin reductase CurA